MSDVGQLIREANPIQGVPELLADDELNALLLLAQTRSGIVEVQELTKPAEPEKNQQRGWLVATAAFAGVILVVGAVMLLANPADELPPATTPTTAAAIEEGVEEATATTVVPAADALTARDQELVTAFIAAFNQKDDETILQAFAPSASFSTSIRPGSGIDGFGDELAYRWALNAQWELLDCKIEFSAISCGIEMSRDDFPDSNEPLAGKLRLITDKGAITSFSLVEDTQTIIPMANAFYSWVEDNHPTSLREMSWGTGNPPFPLLTEESIALWVELIPQYKASLDS